MAVPRVEERVRYQRLTVAGVVVLPGNQCGDFVDVVEGEWSNHQRIMA